MDTLALKRIEIDGKRRDKCLALAGLHLGDLAAVERDAADQLHIIMPLAKGADGRLADRRKDFGDQVVELLAVGQPLPEPLGLTAQFVIGKRRDIGFKPVDRVDIFTEPANIAIVGRSEDAFCHCGEHGIPLKTRSSRKRAKASADAGEIALGDVRSAPLIVN